MKTTLLASACVLSLALAACSTSPDQLDQGDHTGHTATATSTAAQTPMATTSTLSSAHVNLASASGSLVSGKLSVMPMDGGLHLRGEVGGLTPGSQHAIHIHEKGDCSAADASSAGGHFDPTGQPHGKVDAGAHHAGDMNNLTANAQGVASVDLHASGPVLGGGGANDAIGKAVIVHGAPDDYTSQPAGNAGPRVACGVIMAGA